MIILVIILSLLSPALVLLFTFKSTEINKSAYLPALMIGFSMAVVFYGYIPDQGADIIRHVRWLAYYRNIPIWKCFDAGHYSLTYTWDLWSWIIAQTNNENLLQASGAFIGYTLSSYIVFDTFRFIEGKNRKGLFLSFFILICMIAPNGVAIGIRNTNAFIICGFAFYMFFRKRINYLTTFILLMVGVLLHHAAALALIIWVLFPLFKKNKKVASIVSFFSCLSFELIYSRLLLPLVGGGQGGIAALFEDVVDNAYIAFEGRDLFRYTSLNSTVNKWAGIILVLLIILHNSKALKNADEQSSSSYSMMTDLHYLSIFIFVIALGLSITFALNGNRFIGLAGIVAIAPLSYSIEKKNLSFVFRTNEMLDLLLFMVSIAELLLHMYSLDYGTGSLISLLADGLLGVIWPIMVTT